MKLIHKLFVFFFFLIILFFMITTMFNNEKVSVIERRNLTTFPKFSIANLFDKKYYDDLTTAFNDQLELREHLVKGYFLFQFQRYYGDVVIGEDKQLYSAAMDDLGDSYYEDLKNKMKLVNEVSRGIDAKFIFLSIPRKDAYMINELPKNYNSSLDIYKKQVEIAKSNLSSDIIFIDAYDVFDKNEQYYCYYSNDHHTTPLCSYSLYKEINDNILVDTYKFDDLFSIKQTIVNGAYNRQIGLKVKSEPEDLYLVPMKHISYVRYEDGKISDKKVYDKGSTYEDAYMEGDNAFTRVINKSGNGKKILFVGSSYTNILESLAIPSYSEMLSIDYRHNKTGMGINDYVKKYDIYYVVFVPAQSNNSYSLGKIEEHLGK